MAGGEQFPGRFLSAYALLNSCRTVHYGKKVIGNTTNNSTKVPQKKMEVGEDFAVTNLNKKDAFEEAFTSVGLQVEKVHVRVQIRNRKKCITTAQGLAEDLDLNRILKALKKSFKCNGAIVKDEKGGYGEIIQLQGDHRAGIVDFLVSEEIVPKEMIVVHGF